MTELTPDQFHALLDYIDARITQAVDKHITQDHNRMDSLTSFHHKQFVDSARITLAETFGLTYQEASR